MEKAGKRGSKLKKAFIILLIIVLLLCAASAVINLLVIKRASERIISRQEAGAAEADCVLVLGAGVTESGNPSLMLAERLNEGLGLYMAGASDTLLMSGDHGRSDYDEVNVMKDYAVGAGVPSSRVFMDHAGFSTYESIYRARDVFKAEKVIIVTQKYHLYRALYIADRLGLEAFGVACDTREYAGQSYRDIREYAARVKDFLVCIVKPEPTYLGEAIPVSGDGDATND